MSAEQSAQFNLEILSGDLLQFDAPGYLSDEGNVGFGGGRLGDICDVRAPVSGYKVRFWGASPPFSIGPGIPNYNVHDYNPGPSSFAGDPNEVADFVIGISVIMCKQSTDLHFSVGHCCACPFKTKAICALVFHLKRCYCRCFWR